MTKSARIYGGGSGRSIRRLWVMLMIVSITWRSVKYSLPPISYDWLAISGFSNAQIKQVTRSSTHRGWINVWPELGIGKRNGAVRSNRARLFVKLSSGPRITEERMIV